MSIHEFTVRLRFDPEGWTDEIRYADSDGCGHEQVFAPVCELTDLVSYHLRHYNFHHETTPPKRCGYSITLEDGSSLFCTKEPHRDADGSYLGTHTFEVES